MVTKVRRQGNKFVLELSSGEQINADRIVLATGLEHMAYTPPQLENLPPQLRSHSVDHHDLSIFKGREVTVIGGGQSGIETAALLHEAKACVRLLVRKPSLAWNPIPREGRQSLYQSVRHPRTNLGNGLQLWFYANAPSLFCYLPKSVRLDRVRNVLGPAGAWWLKERVVGIPTLLSHSVYSAEDRGGRAVLHVRDQDGRCKELSSDHVIAAAGYQFRLDRLPFLHENLRFHIRHEQQLPILSPNFESSVPGLYFAGLASSYSFGPAMRFIHGASYTAQRISSHLAAARRFHARSIVGCAPTPGSPELSGLHAPLGKKVLE
jgi:thioredoxin reductase